jgi:hypothetical protein
MLSRLLLLALPLARGNDGAQANCPCLTSWDRTEWYVDGSTTEIEISLGGLSYTLPADYGILNCTTHDVGTEPYCDVANPPDWCTSEWCYVDPSNCALPTALSSYFGDAGLRYSYRTCGSSNSWASWFGENAAADGSHQITDIADRLEEYLVGIVEEIETNQRELTNANPTCTPELACECGAEQGGTCVDSDIWMQALDIQKTTYWPRSDSTALEARVDTCLATIVAD